MFGPDQQDVELHSTFEREVQDFKSSPLGQALLRGDRMPPVPDDIAPRLRALLRQI
jgi:hypothetical protein